VIRTEGRRNNEMSLPNFKTVQEEGGVSMSNEKTLFPIDLADEKRERIRHVENHRREKERSDLKTEKPT